MRVAVLSGKGGTGKTLVSVNLAAVAEKSTYIDCDVEAPNGHLFFKPKSLNEVDVTVKLPIVSQVLCNGCRKCVDFCKFNALALIKEKLIIFDTVCHACGGCSMLCPQGALIEGEKVIGKIKIGTSDQVNVHSGILNLGESSGMPIIKKLLHQDIPNTDTLTLIDCPPGSACVVMASIKDADYCILVAEPTVFGVHNLTMVYELVQLFKKPFGVVLNKCLEGDNPAEIFCLEKHIKILSRLPYDNELGFSNSNAEIVVRKHKAYKDVFSRLLETIKKEVQYETTSNS